MKILVDMNLSPAWVPFLNGRGFQASHWSGVGAASAPDAEILEYAETHGFVLFTHDLDFGMLLAARGAKAPSPHFSHSFGCGLRETGTFCLALNPSPRSVSGPAGSNRRAP
jgi:hypothetical protein